MDNGANRHELDKIKEYEKLGYTASYKMENGKLKDLSSGKYFEKTEVSILNEFRYEGMSNPSDMSILYVIQTVDGSKGTSLVSYGSTGDTELGMFFADVSFDVHNAHCNH